MDWIESLQNAIDYIEEHITEKIDYFLFIKCLLFADVVDFFTPISRGFGSFDCQPVTE